LGARFGHRLVAQNATVGEERRTTFHVRDSVTEDEFAAMREMRDKTQTMPRLILPSLQVNIRAGHLPMWSPIPPPGSRP
jgi:hypothetical protein